MIEFEVLNYLLSKNLEGIGENIFLEVPVEKPSAYILIEKTSESQENYLHHAVVAIQSISAERLITAMKINRLVLEAMDSMADETDIFGCHKNNDYNFTNTQTKEYRYQAVFEINY